MIVGPYNHFSSSLQVSTWPSSMKLATRSVLAVLELSMSTVRIQNFKIRPLGAFEKNAFLYVATEVPFSRYSVSRVFTENARIAISQKRHFRSPKRKTETTFIDLITPQNAGEFASETTFGHSKVFFWPLLRTQTRFSQIPPIAGF